MSAFHDQFSRKYDVAAPSLIRKAVIIASTQRSGSSLLGHYLKDSGGFGVPIEYFNAQNLAHWRKRFEFSSVNSLLDQVEPCRTTPNGVFAIKSHYFQLRNFGTIRDLQLRYQNCSFVRIVRRDLLAQAISRTVAQQTGVWISGQAPVGDAHYDFLQIAENLRILDQQDQQWRLSFAATGTPFLEVVYEDFVLNPAAGIQLIAEYCNIDPATLVFPSTPPLERQKNNRSRDWAAQFADEFDENSENILHGHQRPLDSIKDLARWTKSNLSFSAGKERWYQSPNLAEAD